MVYDARIRGQGEAETRWKGCLGMKKKLGQKQDSIIRW